MTLLTKTTFRNGWTRLRTGAFWLGRLPRSTKVSGTARFIGRGLVDLLYPPSCVSCAAELDERAVRSRDVHLCDECFEAMELFAEPMCVRCGAPVPAIATTGNG